MALAEKIETLISLFSINEKPSGEKDPFGLRRNAIGIIRILVEKNIPLDLISIIEKFYPNKQNNEVDDLINFIKDRLKNFLKDNEYNALEVEAVTEPIPHQFNTIIKKLKAIQEFQKLNEAEALISSNKRVSNILKNYNFQKSIAINKSLLIETEEKELANYLDQIGPDTLKKIDQENYIDALSNLVKLKKPIDEFFDHVMVNAEDDKVKQNRYNLLKMLKDTMNAVADISKLSNS
jgi:glycyl-tRNA synthetase beta chain